MNRFATLVFLAVAIAAITAATSAHAGSSATSADPVVVQTKFPASGELTVKSVIARSKPSLKAKAIKTLKWFRPDYRKTQVLALRSTIAPNGTPWYRIEVPMRPNGTYGWIPASAVDLKPTVAQIVIHVGQRTIDVFRNGKHKLHAKVAVGRPGMETPLGKYYVTAVFDHPAAYLGTYAFETSAYSRLSDWPGGGVVGIHGTDQPHLIGQAVSHGCVRVLNTTASAVKRLAPLGTPILIKRS